MAAAIIRALRCLSTTTQTSAEILSLARAMSQNNSAAHSLLSLAAQSAPSFMTLSPAVQAVVLVAHSLLGHHFETVSLWGRLVHSHESPNSALASLSHAVVLCYRDQQQTLSTTASHEMLRKLHFALIKSLVKQYQLTEAKKLLLSIAETNSAIPELQLIPSNKSSSDPDSSNTNLAVNNENIYVSVGSVKSKKVSLPSAVDKPSRNATRNTYKAENNNSNAIDATIHAINPDQSNLSSDPSKSLDSSNSSADSTSNLLSLNSSGLSNSLSSIFESSHTSNLSSNGITHFPPPSSPEPHPWVTPRLLSLLLAGHVTSSRHSESASAMRLAKRWASEYGVQHTRRTGAYLMAGLVKRGVIEPFKLNVDNGSIDTDMNNLASKDGTILSDSSNITGNQINDGTKRTESTVKPIEEISNIPSATKTHPQPNSHQQLILTKQQKGREAKNQLCKLFTGGTDSRQPYTQNLEFLQYHVQALVQLGLGTFANPVVESMVTIWKRLGVEGVRTKQDDERIVVAYSSLAHSCLNVKDLASRGPNAHGKDTFDEATSTSVASSAETAAIHNQSLKIPRTVPQNPLQVTSEILKIHSTVRELNLTPSLYCYTPLLYAYYKYGGMEKLVSCFDEMVAAGVDPDAGVYTILMRAYTLENLFDNVKEIYEEIVVRRGWVPSVRVLTTWMVSLSLQGEMEECIGLFEALERWGIVPDQIMFHVIMNGYAQSSDVGNVLAWYNRLLSSDLQPNVVTYTIVMLAISRSSDPEATRRWYDRIFSSSILPNVHTYSLLIHDRAKRGDLSAAMQIYKDLMNTNIQSTSATFTALINAHVVHSGETGGSAGESMREALELCSEMVKSRARADVAVYHVMMKMFSAMGRTEQAIEIYEKMRDASRFGVRRDISAEDEGVEEEERVVVEPDETMYMTAIVLYSQVENLEKMEETLREMLRRARVLGIKKYPPVLVLQTVLLKLGQMLWRRRKGTQSSPERDELEQRVSALFLNLFREFLSCDATGPNAIMPTPELFEKLIRATARNGKTGLAVMLYKEMVKQDMASGLESVTREIMFEALVANSEVNSLENIVEAFGASFVAKTSMLDAKYLNQSLQLYRQKNLWNSIEVLDRVLDLLNSTVRDCSAEAQKSKARSKSATAFTLTTFSISRQQQENFGIPTDTILFFLETFNGSVTDCALLPRVWRKLLDLECIPQIDQRPILVYCEMLARNAMWNDFVEVLTKQCKEFGWRKGDIAYSGLFEEGYRILERYAKDLKVYRAKRKAIDNFWKKDTKHGSDNKR